MSPTGRPSGPAWFDIPAPDTARARHVCQGLFSWPVKLFDETGAPVGDPDGNRIGLVSR